MQLVLRRLPAAITAVVFLVSAPLRAQSPSVQTAPPGITPPELNNRLTTYHSSERLKDYFKRTVGLRPFLASAAVAGIQQARNAPSAWEQGMEGYGRRFGSSFAKRGISNTAQLGVEAMLGEDSRYAYSDRNGIWPRLKDAVTRSLVVRTVDGGREVAVGRIAGTMAGGLLSRTWQPEGHRGIRNGFQNGGISFGGYIGWNVIREFTRGISKRLPL